MAHDKDTSEMTDNARERSLVERAAERIDASGVGRAAPPFMNGDAAARAARQEARARHRLPPARIDFRRLERLGFLTPKSMRSRLAEQLRLIKRNVLQDFTRRKGERPNLIMISSATPNEGKTFIAVNLALSLACELDIYVLLVDADFQRPSVFDTLGLSAGPGLLDVLENPERDLGEVIQRTDIDRLSLVSAGDSQPHSTELLGSQRMQRIADELSGRYPDRLIIFDAPPLLGASEAAVMAEVMGQILLVVEANRTQRANIEEALDILPASSDPALVLNKARSRSGAGMLYGQAEYRR